MSASRQLADVLGRFSEGCESFLVSAAADIAPDDHRNRTGRSTPEAVLARAIEVEVIPRLMLAHRLPGVLRTAQRRKAKLISADEIAEFARISVQHDVSVAEAYVEALTDQGVTTEQIFSKLFAPAARLLGQLWESDHLTFSDVTIGLSRIQQLIHMFSPFFEAEDEHKLSARSGLLVPMPGEHHSLGLMLVEEFFRRAGWNIWSPCDLADKQIIDTVKQERFDMVGISVTCQLQVGRLSALIKAIRAASANRGIVVMVGGRVFNDRPHFVADVGADATDADGSHAVDLFEMRTERLRGH